MNSEGRSNALGNERAFRAISYTLVFLMVVCLIMAISRLIHNFVPAWHSGVIAGVMLLVVIDRLFLHQRLKSSPAFSAEWTLTIGTQWIVFIVFIRLLLSYANGLAAFVSDMRHFAQGDLEEFLSPEFVFALLFAALAWYLPATFLELLDEIGLNQRLALGEEAALIQSDAAAAHRRLIHLIFNLGIALVILTALARLDLRVALSNPADSLVNSSRFSAGEAGVLLYFILGLALLAQARLMSLQTGWNVQRIPISSDNFAKQWGIYSLIFLFVIVVAVSLLPTGDSFGIFSVLGVLFNFLLLILFFIWQVLVGLIFILFSIPFLLLGKEPQLMKQLPPAPVLPPEALEPIMPPGASALWILIRSILLWGGLLLIIGFSLRQFIRQHDNLMVTLRKARIVNWLVLAWQWLRSNARRTRTSLSRLIADGWERMVARLEGGRGLPRPGWVSLRSLDPRRRIYFFYLTMIRRGGEQGVPRKPSQTPCEYAVALEKNLPSATEDIDLITQAFTEARYSRRDIDARQAEIVKTTWGRIRRAFQERSRSESSRKQ
jgi:hypothetical protein